MSNPRTRLTITLPTPLHTKLMLLHKDPFTSNTRKGKLSAHISALLERDLSSSPFPGLERFRSQGRTSRIIGETLHLGPHRIQLPREIPLALIADLICILNHCSHAEVGDYIYQSPGQGESQ